MPEIKAAYRSDHSPIEISLNISKHPRGRGQWKFNNKLLEQQEYLNMVKREIQLAKATYGLDQAVTESQNCSCQEFYQLSHIASLPYYTSL